MLKISKEELSWLYIPDRIPIEQVVKKIRLPQKGNILGEIDMTLTPYLEMPLSLIGNSKVKWIIIIAPTQSGKTVFLQAAVADSIDQDPGPLLYLLPNEKMGRKHIKEKVIEMINETPDLAAHKTERVRDVSKSGIELDHMTIHLGWGGSLGSVSSFPMKRVCVDEARLMPLTVGGESNPIQLAEDRLTTYLDMGIGQGYIVSSPSIEGDLLHQQLDRVNTSVWFWQVPCPECREYQPLSFRHNIKNGKCLCRYCGAQFSDEDKKRSFNAEGRYVRRVLNDDNKWEHTTADESSEDFHPFEVTETMVFWWNSEVSPFRSFNRIWNKHEDVKNKLHDYKNFYQCWEAEFWVDDISKTSAVKLKQRKVDTYTKGEVPQSVRVITTGIDTQDDGFYVVVRGWGSRKYTGLIDQYYIPCSMETASRDDVIEAFQKIEEHIYIGEKVRWKSCLTAIDTGGHRTKELYEAIANFNNFIMVKGRNSQHVRFSYNKDLNLYLVRTCEYLDETEERSDSTSFILPRDTDDDFCIQYCNIRKIKETNKKSGENKIIWKKTGQCDYRMADVHSFICLDIPTDLGVLRHKIEEEFFEYNPYKKVKEVVYSEQNSSPSNTTHEESYNAYDDNGKDWV
jgi:phage terminase large subunit GpA-like protein